MKKRRSDHFSGVAGHYASHRPGYPDALFTHLADLAPGRALAWDCAAGSGQAGSGLAARFRQVVATDASHGQLAAGPGRPNVARWVAAAEASGLPDESVDLIAVAQALHWFDLDRFYREANRVLAPRGILAAWSYGVMKVDGREINHRVRRFYGKTVGPYWPPERRLVETGYRTLPFPFPELESPGFAMEANWTLPDLLGYLRSWSATGRYLAERGRDPVAGLEDELSPLWGDPAARRMVSWPLALRIGRKGPAAEPRGQALGGPAE